MHTVTQLGTLSAAAAQRAAAASLITEFGLEGTRNILAECDPGNQLASRIAAAVDDVTAGAAR